MTTLYVVMEGEYSDKSIVGVYDTRAAADAVAKLCRDFGRVYEYTLNEWAHEALRGLQCWHVRMSRLGIVGTELDDLYTTSAFVEAGQYSIRPNGDLVTTVWAKNDEHAVKIVNKLRTRLLANDQYIIPSVSTR